MTFKCVNRLFTLIIYYKLLEVPSYETQSYYNSPFVTESSDSNGSKSSYGPVLHSYIWTPYSTLLNCNIYIEITCLSQGYGLLGGHATYNLHKHDMTDRLHAAGT
jgi:hypothetical protein